MHHEPLRKPRNEVGRECCLQKLRSQVFRGNTLFLSREARA